MPNDSSKLTLKPGQACKVCGVRYQQGHGICRRCQRDYGEIVVVALAEQERQRAEALAAAILEPAPFVEAVYIGRVFVVVWDGSHRFESPSEAVHRFNSGG